jgi:hypothetical protein
MQQQQQQQQQQEHLHHHHNNTAREMEHAPASKALYTQLHSVINGALLWC